MLIEVALPLPLFRTFTYEVADADVSADVRRVAIGSRVVVPFRNKRQLGIIVGTNVAPPEKGAVTIKRVVDIPDGVPVVDAAMLALCRWIAGYYVVPLGIVLRTALPISITGAADPTPTRKTRRIAVIQRELPSLQHRDELFARSPQQRAVYELVESLGGRASIEMLTERMHFSASVLKGLRTRGLIAIEDEVVARDPFADRRVPRAGAHTPTPAQRDAIARLSSAAGGDVFLLHGVTGSGKTLVYIELLREVVERRGQNAIVLVPEIALTPQTVDRFRAVFGDQVAVLHSALSDGERYDEWLALQSGAKRIAVGARSAIFAPLANVGAIIVDEEHESSYKQGESPRYHAREVAVVRAKHTGAVVVLGSATPSLESWHNVEVKKYQLLSLPERVGNAKLPAVEVIDLRLPKNAQEHAAHLRALADPFRLAISEPLEDGIRATLARGEQTILLLNRRGYASFVQCAECGNVDACPQCSISLTYHRSPERLICHYCLREEPPRARCVQCGGVLLKQRGLGTQQVERLLSERFASARIARMDVDTTSGKWAHAEILDRVGRREIDILLGTQMIAKGLDFPDVTLVGVIDADIGINLPDFRASERCFQLLSQVAGRAGRGPRGGRVMIQTRVPGHHAVKCAVTHDFERFVSEELTGRRHPAYPPYVRIANVVISATIDAVAERIASAAADWLRELIRQRAPRGLTLIGPAKCPVERIKMRWRWHFIVKAEHAAELTRLGEFFMRRFAIPKDAEARIAWDRDPVSLM